MVEDEGGASVWVGLQPPHPTFSQTETELESTLFGYFL